MSIRQPHFNLAVSTIVIPNWLLVSSSSCSLLLTPLELFRNVCVSPPLFTTFHATLSGPWWRVTRHPASIPRLLDHNLIINSCLHRGLSEHIAIYHTSRPSWPFLHHTLLGSSTMGQSMTRLPDLPDREAQSWQRQHTHRVRHPSGHSTSKAKVDKSQAPLYSNSRRSVAWEEEPQTRPDRNARDPTQRIKTANQAEKEPWISSHGYRYHSRPHEHQPVEISSRSHRSRKFDRTEGRQNPRPRAPTFETELPERPRRRSSRRELDGKAAIAHVGAASVKVTHEVHEKVSHVKSHLAKQTKECMVCTEKRTTRHFPNRAPTAQCEHEINTCKRCLRHWIRTQFSTRVWDQINCPECRVQMKYEDMREFAPTEIFRR